MNCQGCGWVTKQVETSEKGKGKEGFESVKKRRRLKAKRREESNSHPTSFLSQPTSIPSPLLKTKRQKVEGTPEVPQAAPAPTKVEASTSKSQTQAPSNPLTSSTSLDTTSLPSRSSSIASSIPPHSASASPAPSSASPAPTSLDSKLAATKKRKRSKQPSGLAELLAKKKKDVGSGGAMGGGGGGGGLGLQDFLQGL